MWRYVEIWGSLLAQRGLHEARKLLEELGIDCSLLLQQPSRLLDQGRTRRRAVAYLLLGLGLGLGLGLRLGLGLGVRLGL